MKPIAPALSVMVLLSACAPQQPSAPVTEATFCTGAIGAICAFVNAPLQLAADIIRLPKRPYPFQPLAQELTFVDKGERVWIAPKGILTDGASIPPAFVSVVGRPTDPRFAKAAAIHDSYCGIGNEGTTYFHTRPWKDTHRMFYEALRVGGAPEKTAKTMFAAVYMGGPRWNYTRRDPIVSTQGRGEVVSSQSAVDTIERSDLDHVPVSVLRDRLAAIVEEINARNPGILEIEVMVDDAEADLLQQFPPAQTFEPADPEQIGYDFEPDEEPEEEPTEEEPEDTGEDDGDLDFFPR